MSPNRAKHKATHAKHHAALTTLEREWRVHRGESPNPWRPMDSYDEGAGTRVMQIVTKRGMSNLERRSLSETSGE